MRGGFVLDMRNPVPGTGSALYQQLVKGGVGWTEVDLILEGFLSFPLGAKVE
ncbi:hypothetical protein TcasGA2_TC007522 [Tribolium castaneum]|uniref:Uncharacterized protein n=1 Tax=Tribolium castaneum TaxID=7070 RepID=D2A3H0_TRICA|nr:hypothetical protein TcasGA2_TC007522 [Tribolium castaneum]